MERVVDLPKNRSEPANYRWHRQRLRILLKRNRKCVAETLAWSPAANENGPSSHNCSGSPGPRIGLRPGCVRALRASYIHEVSPHKVMRRTVPAGVGQPLKRCERIPAGAAARSIPVMPSASAPG